MEQQIRFCTSADGTRIAYATYGSGGGTPLVIHHAWPFNQQAWWQLPQGRAVYEGLGKGRLLVTYDCRGVGSSQRDIQTLSWQVILDDFIAVVEDVGLKRFDVFSWAANRRAVAYCTSHGERVRRLILWEPREREQDSERMVKVIQSDWSLARRAMAAVVYPTGPVELQRWWSNMVRTSLSPEIATRYLQLGDMADVAPFSELLARVQTSTLVIQLSGAPAAYRETPAIAAAMPNARLVTVEGNEAIWYQDGEQIVRTVRQFLEGDDAKQALPSGTAIILFLDIAGSTELTTRLGDAAYREKERELDAALRQAIREAGGSPVEGKVLGDGVMAVFSSASNAIEAALRCQALGDGDGLPLHSGVHAGDVIREGNNVHGGAVQVAARIADASAAGEVLVSQTVRDLARTSAGVSFEDRGERELKGVSEPVRVFAVSSVGESPLPS